MPLPAVSSQKWSSNCSYAVGNCGMSQQKTECNWIVYTSGGNLRTGVSFLEKGQSFPMARRTSLHGSIMLNALTKNYFNNFKGLPLAFECSKEFPISDLRFGVTWQAKDVICKKKVRRGHLQVIAFSKYEGWMSSAGVPGSASVQTVLLPAQTPMQPLIPSPGVYPECFEIAGEATLSGHVQISGAKNSALAVLAGALCTNQEVNLRMIPDLHDIRRMFQVLQSIGVRIRRESSDIIVDARCITSVEPCPDVVRKLRASFFVIGALVGRLGKAVVPLPGGCNIGARPIDLHVRGLEALGAHVEIRHGKVHASAANGSKLVGGRFCLDYPSVGATETLMMAAALAEGESLLCNVAQEPEVADLADFLNSCGAKIDGAGTRNLRIKGVKNLHGSDFTIIPDRIEAGTFLIAAAVTRSTISMSRVVPHHLTAVISKLEEVGCKIRQTAPDGLQISSPAYLYGSNLTTLPYPGFPTDLQPQFMSLLTTCRGHSLVEETVFENRMRHVEELQKLGAKVKVSKNIAAISGKDLGSSLYGAPVIATDLRAGAALVLAGMAAEGTTEIEGVGHIDRGYEKLDEKLKKIGANIVRRPCLPLELTL